MVYRGKKIISRGDIEMKFQRRFLHFGQLLKLNIAGVIAARCYAIARPMPSCGVCLSGWVSVCLVRILSRNVQRYGRSCYGM